MNIVRRPIIDKTVVTVAAFVAGPEIRNVRAAAGLTPFAINETAIGVDPVAHTYKGMPHTIQINMPIFRP